MEDTAIIGGIDDEAFISRPTLKLRFRRGLLEQLYECQGHLDFASGRAKHWQEWRPIAVVDHDAPMRIDR